MPKREKRTNRLLLVIIGIVVALLVINQFVDLNPTWKQPQTIKSKNGLLNINLNVTNKNVNIGGKTQKENVYNGKYIDDTWEVKPGDRIKLKLSNNGTQPTNLHLHGFHVSPKGNSDNVLLNIKQGENFNYEYNLPKNLPPGLYWYHPHLHHYTEQQVMGGMLGAIIVRGNIDELPGIKGVPEKVLVLTTFDKNNTITRLVNNQKNPILYVRPFETVRLRIVNASADDYYNFAIPGQKLNIISRDGNTLSQVDSVDSDLLSPGDRIEILFKAGLPGDYPVKSLKYNEGVTHYPEEEFMKIRVIGLPVIPKPLPTKLIPYKDLRSVHVDKVRTITFSQADENGNTLFFIDGKEFDPNVIGQVMKLGTTEQWNIINKSNESHPFHIHINPFQVISVNGENVDRKGYDDTFNVPIKGSVVIRTQYKDFDGKYVMHCHILFHEDNGMMQVVEVVKPGKETSKDNGMPLREGMPEMDHSEMEESPIAGRYKKRITPTPINYMHMHM